MKCLKALAMTTVLCGAGAFGTANADFLGVTVGGGMWNASPSGWVRHQNDDKLDVEDDLGMGDDTTGYAWIDVEHPIPLLPNVKLQYLPLQFDGEGTVNRVVNFRGVNIEVGDDVTSKLKLNQTDVVLYYQLLDNVVSLDLGMNVKVVNGFVRVHDKTRNETDKVTFNGALPLAYGMFRADLPLTGLYVGVEGSGMSYSGNQIFEVKGTLGYDITDNLGVQGGYWKQHVKLDDVDNIDADVDVGGAFGGVYLHF